MAGKKYKATGCARLILVLLIMVPVAYFGAKLIRGGEGIPIVDDFIDSIMNKKDKDVKEIDDMVPKRDLERLKKENDMLKQRIKELESQAESQ